MNTTGHHHSHASIGRRCAIGSVAAAGLSAWLGQMVARAAENDSSGPDAKPAPYRRCITLWMAGGPSQFETFDPKPNSDSAGPLSTVATSIPGVHFCETLGNLAGRADDLCVLRSVGSTQGEHERASYLMHTGFERIAAFPRPSLGSLVSHQVDGGAMPRFVTLGPQTYGPAYLGSQHGPMVIDDLARTRGMLDQVGSRSGQLDLISELNSGFGKQHPSKSLVRRADQIDSVRRMIDSPLASSLDVDRETEATRRRYGDSDFGRRVLIARRLLESGTRYVEVQMPGWDTHVGNGPAVKRLCGQLEPAWVALMDDLKSSGLWQDTLVLWMGEFGRTPSINGQAGRDHFPQSIPVVMAGHSFGGRVIGSTGPDGRAAQDEPSGVADLIATLMTLLGIDPDQTYTTDFGSPTTATDGGRLIPGVV